MCMTDVIIMVMEYEKKSHTKSKGVMATNEQGGSMLNNQSYPQEYKVGLCLIKCHMKCDKVLCNSGNRKR